MPTTQISENLLFSLLKESLWRKQTIDFGKSLSARIWEEVLKIAKEQSVVGLITEVISHGNYFELDKSQKLDIVSYILSIKKRNELINNELVNISTVLKRHGIRFCVVKGQTVALLYPIATNRTAGDIDFYCSTVDNLRLRNLLKNTGIDITDDYVQHYSFIRNSVEYEIHYKLVNFNITSHQKYWDNLVENDIKQNFNVIIDGNHIPTLTPTLNAAFIFIHLYHHFLKEGVGLRQFCDWAMVLDHYESLIDKNQLKMILKYLGYTKAFRCFGSILIDKIGLNEQKFPFIIKSNDRKFGHRILKEVMRGGNFGWYGRLINKNGLLHSIETGSIAIRHCLVYWKLSPKENLMFIPVLLERFLSNYRRK